MISTALLLSLAAQTEPAVTLNLPITPLPAVCREIEAQTGIPHLASGPGRGQQVFVKVSGMPASRLRDSLAEVTQGKWVRSGDGFMLMTTEESSKSDETFRKRLTAWFKKEPPIGPLDRKAVEDAIKKSLEGPKLDADRTMAFMVASAANSQTPKRRFVVRLVQRIGLNDLLTIGEDERRVYAANPTSLQRRLPAAAAGAAAEYEKESRLYADTARRLAPPKVDDEQQQFNPLVDPYLGDSPLKTPAAALVIMKRMMGSLMVEVKLYDSKGLLFDSVSESFGSEAMMEALAASSGKEDEMFHPALKGLDVPLKLSEEDRAFAKDLKAVFSGGVANAPSVSETTKQRLLNMDKVDPLLFAPTQMLVQLAELKKKQVVAKVTDLAIFSSAFGVDMEKDPTLTTAISLALGAFMSKAEGISEQPDLLTLRPSASDFIPFSPQMDRPATANFFRTIVSGGDTLDAMAALAVTSTSAMDLQLPTMLGMMLGGDVQSYYDDSSYNMLKLYGMLDGRQKGLVKQGGCLLPLGSLVGPIAAHARKMLLNGGSSLIYMGGNEGVAVSAFDAEGPLHVPDGGEKYEDEITVKLARLPAHLGVLKITMTSKEAFFMKTGVGPMSSTTETDASQAAYSIATQEAYPGEQYTKVRGFVYGSQRHLNSEFVFGKEVLSRAVLQAPLIPKGAKLMSLKDLPAAFQEEVQKELVNARKAMQEAPRGDGGGRVKPPL